MAKVVPVDDDSLVPEVASHKISKAKVVPINITTVPSSAKTTKGCGDFKLTLMKVLKGYLNEYNEIKTNYYTVDINGIDTEIIYKESMKLKVFVSSTFTDTHEGLIIIIIIIIITITIIIIRA